MKNENNWGFDTNAIRAGEYRDPATGAHNTPIYQTATFSFETSEDLTHAFKNYDDPNGPNLYTREGNPTIDMLQDKMSVLQGTESSLAMSSGMATVAAAVRLCAKSGDHVIVTDKLFVISRNFFVEECPEMGIEVTFIDMLDLDSVRSAIKPNTKALFAETITNPQMCVVDLTGLKEIASDHDLSFIVDNTYLGPYLLRPVEYGADLILDSATKYLSGHGDAVGGILCGSEEHIAKARSTMSSFGQCISPFNAWLILRGIRTLPLRMDRHSKNALALANMLKKHEKVDWIRYAGIPESHQTQLIENQFPKGCGGMLSFNIKGDPNNLHQFMNALKMVDMATSLGDVYTLAAARVDYGLIRVSVGCEDEKDILNDFSQALDAVQI
ncbi:aminotransferase class I/II-fold pyridoxal phosphate-dependent enzyme [Emcibacteraceae bacterium]|jgi:methionine-gamma-lyase|nr:aminotransferase class I/II-fold pyridoxal phosphate-dependent enzyme [Kordiimonadaceae bacterium]MDA9770496.1 aminotransferase class I/II-fold pyridoxal phosphate-dependent enzyme [Emcibacteraceae bacterium]MDG1021178.1 aminotransferase class I/II-fold pyridoxal phosphate-dependent enzyme [Emcibacteraceae bacterium]MDG1726633.1 aminotransferase class I/II-fold pyridoxal phosphate-dependent enzyme [Emcibacteraceae bacterium]